VLARLHALARSTLWGIVVVLALYDIAAWLLLLFR
jgi:hypothetical protein